MILDRSFSNDFRAVIAEARLVAIALGYDYISTIHFFLADARLGGPFSIRGFCFPLQDDFESFYRSQRVAEETIFNDDLPLTLEAETTISKGCSLWNDGCYQDREIHPYHFFLAAARVKSSLLFPLLDKGAKTVEALEEYYIGSGRISRENIHPSIWKRLSRRFF